MGCLKNVTRAIFLTVIVVGCVSLGGKNYIKKQIDDTLHPSQDVILQKAQKVGDFSKVNKEFEIEKAVGVLGYNAVLSEHKSSGQKMVVIDSGKKPILTKEDIESSNSEERIKKAIAKFKYQANAIEEFHVTEHGTMRSYGQNIPYVKFRAKIKKLPIGELAGVISVVQDKNGKDKILVSANSKDKYSQLISNEFFKEIK